MLVEDGGISGVEHGLELSLGLMHLVFKLAQRHYRHTLQLQQPSKSISENGNVAAAFKTARLEAFAWRPDWLQPKSNVSP